MFSETSYTIKIFCLMQLTCCDVKWAVMIVFSDFHLSSKTISQQPAPRTISDHRITDLQSAVRCGLSWNMMCQENISNKQFLFWRMGIRGRSGMKNVLISLIYKDLPVAFGYLFMISTEFDHDILFWLQDFAYKVWENIGTLYLLQ